METWRQWRTRPQGPTWREQKSNAEMKKNPKKKNYSDEVGPLNTKKVATSFNEAGALSKIEKDNIKKTKNLQPEVTATIALPGVRKQLPASNLEAFCNSIGSIYSRPFTAGFVTLYEECSKYK